MDAARRTEDELGQAFPKVFRSITADNGSENAMPAGTETSTETPVYFTHPYTSCERGSMLSVHALRHSFSGRLRLLPPLGRFLMKKQTSNPINAQPVIASCISFCIANFLEAL